MNLEIDSTRLILSANFPYPNMECTLTFQCDQDSTISSPIIASSYSTYDQDTILQNGVRTVTYNPVSSMDFQIGQTYSIDLS